MELAVSRLIFLQSMGGFHTNKRRKNSSKALSVLVNALSPEIGWDSCFSDQNNLSDSLLSTK